ncbi:MAG: helix-turn-helix transcriptional regulator [Clostridiales bacterium]|nr:helix-turn-helix transcriptional regulator [Clostridiales bacterium]
MESNSHLIEFGNYFRNTRKEHKLSQIEMYEKLFPDVPKTDENAKKFINSIEHGKMKTLNAELVIRFCKMFDVSADRLLGIRKDYTNHELEFVCEYTGLEENAVKQLHEWCISKNNGSDISKVDEAFLEEEEEEHIKMHEKLEGIAFLRIVNYLFKSGTKKSSTKKKPERYSNLRILYALYLLSMAKPKEVYASVIPNDYAEYLMMQNPYINNWFHHTNVDLNQPISMLDNNSIHYLITPKETLEVLGRKQLDEGVEWLIEQVKHDDISESNK